MTIPITGDGGHLMYQSGIFSQGRLPRRDRPDLGTVEEPARSIPIFRDCDVLVVGGGPSGTAAAIAAARRAACGAAPTKRPLRIGKNAPPPITASSPGRQPSIPSI
jgi:hypothetical protein